MSHQYVNPPNPKLAHRKLLGWWLLLVFILAGINSVINPLFEPPDELQHYQYVRYLVDERKLPVQEIDGPITQSHQPPLYYLLGAFLVGSIHDPQTLPERNPFWAYSRADEVSPDNKRQFIPSAADAFPYAGAALVVHILRFGSVLMALGSTIAIWLLASYLWPGNNGRIMLMLAISVLNPMFLYMAGAVNNDNLIIMLGAVLLWVVAARAIPGEFKWGDTVWLGLIWGAALLAKLSGLALASAWGTALLLTAWNKRDARFFFSRLLVISGLALIVSGWWFAHNWQVYGEPFALETMLSVWGSRPPMDVNLANFWGDVTYAWTNFWGRFGYGQAPLPAVFYWMFGILCLGGIGGGIRLAPRVRTETDFARRAVWQVLLVTTSAFLAAFFYYLFRSSTGANGRYLFPALPAIAALLTASLSVWISRLKNPQWGYWTVTAIIASIAIYTSASFLPWVYAPPKLLSETEARAEIQNPADIVFAQKIRLLGTAVSSPEAASGQSVNITACWQSLDEMTTNYTLYVRLLDSDFNSLGQRDTYPGLGKYPTSLWQKGDIFCDAYPIPVTADLIWPIAATIDLGFYDLETGRPLPAAGREGEAISRVAVGQIKINPANPPPPPLFANEADEAFAQGVQLIGYTWSAETARPGETITLELVWQAGGPLDASYTVFTHFLDAGGEILAQDDHLPRNGRYPTNFWGAGDIIVDAYTFTLPDGASPGPTSLRLGLYQLESLQRLPRLPDASQPDFALLHGPIISTADEE